MAIILARHGRPIMTLEKTIIEEEITLQRYLDEHPDILPLDQLQADIRPLVLVREFPTTSGPIDAIAVDQNANIYLIETKLYKNPDKRLVLAQVLDYGAALWKGYSDPDDFIFELDSEMQKRTGKGLSQLISDDYGLEAEGAIEFRARLKSNIASGRFRFVVLMNTVEDRLKRLIEYVNANSEFKILGVGLDFYRHEDIDVLIPTLYGGGTIKPPRPPPHVWTEERFFDDASAHLSAEHLQALRTLYEWVKANADDHDPSFGTGRIGLFSPKFAAVSPRSVLTVYSDGRLWVNFGGLDKPESAKAWREQLGRSLQQNGFSMPPEFIKHNTRVLEWIPRISDFVRILSTEIENAKESAEQL